MIPWPPLAPPLFVLIKCNSSYEVVYSARLASIDSQASSFDTTLAFDARGCEFESHQFQCSPENLVCLKFCWTRNSLLIVSWKLVQNFRSWSWLRWLFMVWVGYSSPCGWRSACLNSVSRYGLLWASEVSEHLQSVLRPHGIQSRGVVHLKSLAWFFSPIEPHELLGVQYCKGFHVYYRAGWTPVLTMHLLLFPRLDLLELYRFLFK